MADEPLKPREERASNFMDNFREAGCGRKTDVGSSLDTQGRNRRDRRYVRNGLNET